MPIEMIIQYEEKPLFKLFLRRIWFNNYADYLNLFGNDIEKRKETVRRFIKTYPNLFFNNQKQND